ncbi:MAG: putative toxin-antitoxin system toxin component, PIN family [Bacteroidota bacterium]|nr:putative toxin-antitoxin system toxin component, PIN family [Bacteroidota bacterium]
MGGELADVASMFADERFEVFTSNEQLAELLDVVERPRFRKYFELAEGRALVGDFTLIAERVEIPVDPPQVCRDPKDDHLLALAKTAKAHYLLTGDSDLLVLKKYGRTQIVKPAAFKREFY